VKPGLTLSVAILLFGVLAPSSRAAAVPGTPVSARSSGSTRADLLRRAAEARLARGGVDERRAVLHELEQAVLLDPDDARLRIAYGWLCFEAGFDLQARTSFERATALDPDDAEARLGLGRVCKRDWIAMLDSTSLAKAVASVSAAVRLDPESCEAWVLLAPLLYERGRLSGARAAAERACAARGDCAEAQLAAAYLSYRGGRIARAESLFAVALPRLPRSFAAHFHDLSPLLTPEMSEEVEELTPPMRDEFEQRFWSEVDPDPTTPENEARLEYWSRVAHAGMLFLDDPDEPRWDMRAELYARYGAPRGVSYENLGLPTSYRMGQIVWVDTRRYGPRQIGMSTDYPIHSQLWDYSNLGMSVILCDHLLTNDYTLMRLKGRSTDPVPDARTLCRSDLVATPGGRGLFPVLPPGARPLPIEGRLARFEGAQGAKLLAQVEVPGAPTDSLWAQCALVDKSARVVARLERELSPSGCDPAVLRTGDFSFDVPPGPYRVAISVRDGHGARGVTRMAREVAPVSAGLSMSDVVVACGPLEAARTSPGIRLDPNPRARVAGGEPLIVYFELYHMAPGPTGQSHFEYEYVVESAGRDARPWYQRVLPFLGREPHYFVRSEEWNVGPLRRQFLTVPVQSLKPGPYRLDVKVRDLVAGTTTTASAGFERLGPAVR
jgi:GWxTD domain-containing protein